MAGLSQKVAIITGASSGIGRAASILFARLGAHLTIASRQRDKLEELKQVCENENPKAKVLVMPTDVCKKEDVERLIASATDTYKRLDILVNSAGIIEMGTIESTSLEQYDRVMAVNTRSIYHLSMLAVPHLISSQGNIVNVSSVNGLRSFAGVLAYNLSKAALDQLTRCMALELAAKQVRVNAVNPGVTITELHKRSGMSDDQYAAFIERSKTTHALGRPGRPEEVAEAIAFLADGERSGFVTGHSLPVDGGRHAMCPR